MTAPADPRMQPIMVTQVCAANGSSLSVDAQLYRLPQLPLLCVVLPLLVAWVCLLGKPSTRPLYAWYDT